MIILKRTGGFTFIEVLVAMMIFVMAVLAAVDIVHGSVRATKDARQLTIATELLESLMVDLETKLETEGFEKGCEKKKDGKFEEPNERFSWVTYCTEIDFNISQAASQMANPETEKDNTTTENQFQKLILDTASKYMTQALRELHVEVSWLDGKEKRKIDLTTHIARYDQPLSIGGIPNL